MEERRVGYVLAIAANRRARLERIELSAARMAAQHWHRYSAGAG
ncbi:hypothetical protein AB0B45_11085 [Nonomuraea sp. NPDC049152]